MGTTVEFKSRQHLITPGLAANISCYMVYPKRTRGGGASPFIR